MATPITSLVAGIKERCGTFLTTTFSELDYGLDVSSNRSRQAKKGYAVVPESAAESDFIIGATIVDQTVRVKLSDVVLPGKTSDQNTQSTTNSLYDNVYGLYDFLVKSRCGAASVINTYGLSVESPKYLDDGVVVIEFTFIVKHRN